MRKLVCSQPARTARPAHPVETYVRVGRGVGKTLMFLLRWWGGGGRVRVFAKVETEVGVQGEAVAGAACELYASFYASSLPPLVSHSSRAP